MKTGGKHVPRPKVPPRKRALGRSSAGHGYALLLILWLAGAVPGWSQSETASDPALLVGLTLESVFSRYGPPKSVYTVRGLEAWQDDVVFEYDEGDFYVYKDRVWQLGLKSAYGITLGAHRAEVVLVLGEGDQNFDDHILYSLPSRSWPLTLRVNLNAAGTVSALFIYRSDF
jgi:hypothetical protein